MFQVEQDDQDKKKRSKKEKQRIPQVQKVEAKIDVELQEPSVRASEAELFKSKDVVVVGHVDADKYVSDLMDNLDELRESLTKGKKKEFTSSEMMQHAMLRIQNDPTLDEPTRVRIYNALGLRAAQAEGMKFSRKLMDGAIGIKSAAQELVPDDDAGEEEKEFYKEQREVLGKIAGGIQAVAENVGSGMRYFAEVANPQIAENLRMPTREKMAEQLLKKEGRVVTEGARAQKAREITAKEYETYVREWFDLNIKTLESYNEAFEEHSYFMGQMFSALMQIEANSATEKVGREMRVEFERRKTARRAARAHELVPPDQAAGETGKLNLEVWETMMTMETKDWQGKKRCMVAEEFRNFTKMGDRLDEKREQWRMLKYARKCAEESNNKAEVLALSKQIVQAELELKAIRAEMVSYFRHGGVAEDTDGKRLTKTVMGSDGKRRTEAMFTDEAKAKSEEKLKKLREKREIQARGLMRYKELVARSKGQLEPPLDDDEKAELAQIKADAVAAATATGSTRLRNPETGFKREMRNLDAEIKPLEDTIQKLKDDQWARLQAGRIVSISWLAGYYDLSDFNGTGDFFGSRLLNYGDSWLPRRGLLQKTKGIWDPMAVEIGSKSSWKVGPPEAERVIAKSAKRDRGGAFGQRDASGRIVNEAQYYANLKEEYEYWQHETGGYFMLNPATPDFFTRLISEAKITVQKSDQDLMVMETSKIAGNIAKKDFVPEAWFKQRMVDPRGERKVSNIKWEDKKLWEAMRRAKTPDRASALDEPAFAIPEQIFQSDQVDEITAAEATRKLFWSAQSFFHNPTLEKFQEMNVLFKHISEWSRQEKGWGDILNRTLDWMKNDPGAKEIMEELQYFPKLEIYRWIEEASGTEMITNKQRDEFIKKYIGQIPLLSPRYSAQWIVELDTMWGMAKSPVMLGKSISDTWRKFWQTLLGQTLGEDVGAKH